MSDFRIIETERGRVAFMWGSGFLVPPNRPIVNLKSERDVLARSNYLKRRGQIEEAEDLWEKFCSQKKMRT